MEYAKQTVCLKLQKILFGPFSRELTRQRLQNCDLERRMLTGTVEGDEDKILEQDHQALVSENQLLGEDNQQLRQDNYALEEQIDELRCLFFWKRDGTNMCTCPEKKRTFVKLTANKKHWSLGANKNEGGIWDPPPKRAVS